MMRSAVVTFIICTSFSTVTLAKEESFGAHQLMFVGSVVRPLCNVLQSGLVVTLSCLNKVATGMDIETYNVASLTNMRPQHSNYKTIQLTTMPQKPSLARMTVIYD